MLLEITSKENDPHGFVIPYAQFHIGKAFYQGYGVPKSEEKAERLVNTNIHYPSELNHLVGGY